VKKNIFFLILLILLLLEVSSCNSDEKRIHPKFAITRNDLEEMTSNLPDRIKASILSRPQVFLEYIMEMLKEPQDIFQLIDKKHSLPSNYVPGDLVSLQKYDLTTSKRNLYLRRILMPDLLAMAEAARIAGTEIILSSTYRSFEYQKRLFDYYVKTEGIKKAERESARPGHSQHQLGTAIDFGSIEDSFINTRQGRWLAKNAWKFGFSLSYPRGEENITGYKYEPWHYRYLGRAACYLIRNFFGNSQQVFLEFYGKNEKIFKEKLLNP